MHRSLSDYISLLAREGELVRIAAPVSPMEEIAEIEEEELMQTLKRLLK